MATPDPPRWQPWQIAVWAVLALVAAAVFGPRFVGMFRPPNDGFYDFSQEWLSARNYYTGDPVYSPQAEAVKRHMARPPANAENLLPWNAHPPAAVLLALPFGRVEDYATAHYYWNLATFPLYLLAVLVILAAVRAVRWYAVFPVVVLTLVSFPVVLNLMQGQLNFVLAPLLALAWWADRRDHQLLAGLALGLAAGLKLFPGFLFIYFLFAGRWRALAAGLAAALAVNAVAWAVFGTEAFTTYVRQVMPGVLDFQSSWRNVSLNGFWQRLYDPRPEDKIVALRESPQLARGLALASQLFVAAVAALVALRAKTPATRDRAVAVGVFGMLLASPVAWTHYFVLLAIPVAVLWVRLRGWPRWAFWPLIVPLWLPENFFALLALGPEQARLLINRQHAPIGAATNLAALSAFTYVLLALFLLATLVRDPAPEPAPEPLPAPPDADLPADVQRVDRRLFGHIGND
jgi:alpha-1,2-mannosyltransferase